MTLVNGNTLLKKFAIMTFCTKQHLLRVPDISFTLAKYFPSIFFCPWEVLVVGRKVLNLCKLCELISCKNKSDCRAWVPRNVVNLGTFQICPNLRRREPQSGFKSPGRTKTKMQFRLMTVLWLCVCRCETHAPRHGQRWRRKSGGWGEQARHTGHGGDAAIPGSRTHRVGVRRGAPLRHRVLRRGSRVAEGKLRHAEPVHPQRARAQGPGPPRLVPGPGPQSRRGDGRSGRRGRRRRTRGCAPGPHRHVVSGVPSHEAKRPAAHTPGLQRGHGTGDRAGSQQPQLGAESQWVRPADVPAWFALTRNTWAVTRGSHPPPVHDQLLPRHQHQWSQVSILAHYESRLGGVGRCGRGGVQPAALRLPARRRPWPRPCHALPSRLHAQPRLPRVRLRSWRSSCHPKGRLAVPTVSHHTLSIPKPCWQIEPRHW